MEKADINQITHKIVGRAMQVHRTLGNGFQELIYQRALAIVNEDEQPNKEPQIICSLGLTNS